MIISASYRTDIPTFYGQWFINRLRVVPEPGMLVLLGLSFAVVSRRCRPVAQS